MEPSTNGAGGRFAKGNPGGGNPYVKQVAEWRATLAGAVTPANIRTVTLKLVELAEAGEAWAVKELFDRCLGKPKETIEHQGDPTKLWGKDAPVDSV